MPINNNLPPVKLPVDSKFNEEPTTKYLEQLNNIDVTLLSAPSYTELLSYIPEFSTATWRDKPDKVYTNEEAKDLVTALFNGYLLPTALETVSLTFRIDNMDLIDVTHLIRHRTLSFSAQCTADRDMRHDDAVVKPSIIDTEYYEQYQRIVYAAKVLYADMVDSKNISILDARTILPRCLSSFYYARGNLKDILQFIRTRLDEQIQPESDNIIAMKMLLAIVRQYPELKGSCKIGGRDEWYIKTARSGRNSNIYMPKPENDVFEYNEDDFLYKKCRNKFYGSETYEQLKHEIMREIELI